MDSNVIVDSYSIEEFTAMVNHQVNIVRNNKNNNLFLSWGFGRQNSGAISDAIKAEVEAGEITSQVMIAKVEALDTPEGYLYLLQKAGNAANVVMTL